MEQQRREQELQRRRELHAQNLRQIEQRQQEQANYREAMDKYDAERKRLRNEIDYLSRIEHKGAHKGKIVGLEQQLKALTVPELPK